MSEITWHGSETADMLNLYVSVGSVFKCMLWHNVLMVSWDVYQLQKIMHLMLILCYIKPQCDTEAYRTVSVQQDHRTVIVLFCWTRSWFRSLSCEEESSSQREMRCSAWGGRSQCRLLHIKSSSCGAFRFLPVELRILDLQSGPQQG